MITSFQNKEAIITVKLCTLQKIFVELQYLFLFFIAIILIDLYSPSQFFIWMFLKQQKKIWEKPASLATLTPEQDHSASIHTTESEHDVVKGKGLLIIIHSMIQLFKT